MRPHLNLSAPQLVALSLLGNGIATVVLLSPLLHLKSTGVLGFAGLMPLFLGLGISLFAISQLKCDIRNDRWTEEQLAPLRAATQSAALAVAAYVCFGIFAIATIATQAHRNWGWATYLIAMCLLQLRQATLQPPPRASGPRIDWRNAPPITSDHWGSKADGNPEAKAKPLLTS